MKGLCRDDRETLDVMDGHRVGMLISNEERGVMSVAGKLVIAGMLFLGAVLCIYGFIAEKLINISVLGAFSASAVCAGIFIYFAFFDPEK